VVEDYGQAPHAATERIVHRLEMVGGSNVVRYGTDGTDAVQINEMATFEENLKW